MSKLDTFLGKHGSKIIIILLVLTYFKSCGIDSETNKVKKELVKIQAEVDTLSSSLNSRIVDEQRMIELIKTVPAWKTLRIEEISDKERISINALEEKED
jgi:DNA anti-recombination protein RmuC